MVPQKSVLFTGSISENICWGKKNATEEEIIYAAKIAQADEFIKELPNGYNTQVTREVLIFLAQKQRLTIARAIISKPEILILDDSSSALDFATDASLRTDLKSLSGTMTVLTVFKGLVL